MRRIFLLLTLLAAPVYAQSYYEPARGSVERAAIMNAMRPLAESYLGAPVEFIVSTLRVSGGRALAMLDAQRPGGGQIDLAATPYGQSGVYSPPIDYPGIHGLLALQNGQWVVVEHVFSPTDVWFADPRYCPDWGALVPEACG